MLLARQRIRVPGTFRNPLQQLSTRSVLAIRQNKTSLSPRRLDIFCIARQISCDFRVTKLTFNPHRPRPPRTPAASFKSPYRKRLGPPRSSSPRVSCAEAFPIKASDYTSM